MTENIKNFFNNIEAKNLKLIFNCLKVCFSISLFGIFILFLSYENLISLPLLYTGMKLLYIGIFYSIFSIICGFCIDIIKKKLD